MSSSGQEGVLPFKVKLTVPVLESISTAFMLLVLSI